MIRAVEVTDAERVAAIYNHYIEHTIVTFEEEPLPVEAVAARIARFMADYPWLVYERDGRVAGYAYAAPWHERSAYRRSAETTVYVDADSLRLGIGSALYQALLQILRERGYHSAAGGIALPNDASVALHEKLGFRKVAHFGEVGRKFDRWIDVGYWQLLL